MKSSLEKIPLTVKVDSLHEPLPLARFSITVIYERDITMNVGKFYTRLTDNCASDEYDTVHDLVSGERPQPIGGNYEWMADKLQRLYGPNTYFRVWQGDAWEYSKENNLNDLGKLYAEIGWGDHDGLDIDRIGFALMQWGELCILASGYTARS